MINKLIKYGEIFEDVPLSRYNTYRIGGRAKYISYPDSIINFTGLIRYLRKNNIQHKIFGNGSNMIVSSKDYNGVIIKQPKLDLIELNEETCEVTAESGVKLPILALHVLAYGFVGLEWSAGIPGTVGGSIIGNAGAYNVEIFDCLKSITILNEKNKVETLLASEVVHSYRHSEFKDRDIVVLKATFKVTKGNVDEALELIEERKKIRKQSQPLEYPSAGSVFRNPSDEELAEAYKKYDLKGPFAGHLIESCGLKGAKVNGAEISEKHANFIINKNNATSDDIIKLIEMVSTSVEEKYNCKLKIEQEFFNWE